MCVSVEISCVQTRCIVYEYIRFLLVAMAFTVDFLSAGASDR